MKMFYKGLLAVFLLASVLGLSACKQEGPAERAGQKVDQAVEQTAEKIDRTTYEADKKIDQAGDKIDQATYEAGKKIEQAGEDLSDSSRKTGQ